MRLIFTSLWLFFSLCSYSQLLTWSPSFIQENSTPVDITVDATKGNQGLKDHTPTTDVYVHIGVITSKSASSSDWKYVKFSNFNSPSPTVQATYLGSNKWNFNITGGLRTFFGISDPTEQIRKIALLFRNGNGSKVQRNTDGSDMYIPVYQPGLAVRITNPPTQPKFVPVPEQANYVVGDAVPVTAQSSENADLKLYLNGAQFGSTATNTTSISGNAVISSPGTQTIIAEAVQGGVTRYDTIQFTATSSTVVEALPAGVTDGINYDPNGTDVTLVLFAPGKSNVAVVGEFNNWSPTTPYQMKKTPDGQRFWVRLTGLTPGTEYGYQYLIDGSLRVADFNAEKILDPWNDQYIPAANYPNLKAYPLSSNMGIVSVLQTAKPAYTWQVPNFVRPDKRNLLIYELLVRDFVATQNWQTLKDTLSYLKRLGINAIQVMPFNEFEGNNSWGYNPDFYFAPDKMYGTETALKQFIDECHKQGIAVIMDIAMNHAFGLSPTVQMYWNSTLNRPAADNPWHNEVAKHNFNVGFDFNHESQATKDLVHRVVRHWLTNYKIDGFRWDLSKGFTQTQTCDANGGNCNSDAMAAYDASRIAIWKRIYDTMQNVATGSYGILEHFAANSEEIELSNYGMLIWGNLNHNYNEATMGYVGSSNFQYGIHTNRNWTNPYLVTYQESHDEERLMFKNVTYGNSSNPSHNVKDQNTALKRNEMATAFWAPIPGPKMIWQFGELGYDFSINRCENGTINNDCRTSPKPIRWDYYFDPNRRALYDVYSKLLKLRSVPNFLPTFVTNNITYNLAGGFKTLQVSSDSLKITVIGNFDVNQASSNVTFQEPGTWYNYLTGGTRTATGSSENITLQPGEYYVYLNRDVTNYIAALPLKLVSFAGNRLTNNSVSLTWKTANEENVSHFELQRSANGTSFVTIGKRSANNRQQNTYTYTDNEEVAINAKAKLFYRLHMIDKDGKSSYSNVVTINPTTLKAQIQLYPNPATSTLYIKFDEVQQKPATLKIEDVTGRLYKSFTINNSGSSIIPVNVKVLPPGTYLLKMDTSGKVLVQQFIVQR